MPIFRTILGGGVISGDIEGFYDFKWEGWSEWGRIQQTGVVPTPTFWSVTPGCREKFQMVDVVLINPDA